MTDPLQQLLTDTLASGYRVERELGRGGMARVYLAQDLRHDRQVAVKILLPELARVISGDRFAQEIRIVSRLTHPNIVGLIDSGLARAGDGPAIPYYVMHYVDGESLRDRLLREGQLPVEEAVRIAAEVADALQFAHDRGVVHRDVKPENILFQAGHAMVADFGVARLIAESRDDTADGLPIGTPAYMSPEQWSGDDLIDGRSDLYGLACLLYEMLTGQPPYSGVSGPAIAARHRAEAAPSVRITRPAVPPPVDAIVRRCLEKMPADRYQSAGELQRALVLALAPRMPRRFGRGMAAGALMVAGLAVGAWYLLGQEPPRDLRAVAVEIGDAPSGTDPTLSAELAEAVSRHLAAVPSLTVFDTGDPPVGAVVRVAAAGPDDRLMALARVVDPGTGELLNSQAWHPGPATRETRTAVALQVAALARQTIGQTLALRSAAAGLRGNAAREAVLAAEGRFQRGRELLRGRDYVGAQFEFEQADARLAEAARLDRASPLPWVRRGWIAYNLSFFGARDRDGMIPTLLTAMSYADSALARDSGSAPALGLRGAIGEYLSFMQSDAGDTLVARAEADLRAALVRDPTYGIAHIHLARLYRRAGRMDEASSAAHQARSYDDFLLNGHSVAGQMLILFRELGRPDQARRVCEDGRLLYPMPDFIECRLVHFGYFGHTPAEADSAAAELEWIEGPGGEAEPQTRGYRRAMLAAVLARSGRLDSARGVVERARRARLPGIDYYAAYVLAAGGDTAGVIRTLRPLVQADTSYRAMLRTSFWFRGLQTDPAFRQLAGLVP